MPPGNKRILITLTITGLLLAMAGCYEKKIVNSMHYSTGTWNGDGTRFIFMRWELDMRMPKGLSKFPDGGMPRYLRDERFICVYNKKENTIEKIRTAVGKPRGYPPEARFSWKGSRAVYKIWNEPVHEGAVLVRR